MKNRLISVAAFVTCAALAAGLFALDPASRLYRWWVA